MNDALDAIKLVAMVELPVIGGLFWLVLRLRREAEESLEALRLRADTAQAQVRDALAAYKLEVAKSYVPVGTLKDLELRLTGHLLRIEEKLECSRSGCPHIQEGGR
ncbi:conserved hypothetical protein [uncultured Gammaproteobacteria bacterium]